MCQRFDLHSLLRISNAASVACVAGLWLAVRTAQGESELHKGRLCLIFVLDCICYFSAISSPWCFLLQASGLMVSNGSPHASQ